MFGNIKIGVLLLVSHILASIFIGKLFSYKYKLKYEKIYETNSFNINECNLSFEIITKSITKAIYTMCMIFGFMVIFTLSNNYILKLVSYIFSTNKYIDSFILCIMEVTSGLKSLISLPFNLKTLIIYISLFLGVSSLSIIFQIFSCIYKNKFKLKNILIGKILHGIFSAIITYILVNIPYVYEYMNVVKNVNYNIAKFNYTNIFKNVYFVSFIIFLFHMLIFLAILKKKRLKNRLFKRGIMF